MLLRLTNQEINHASALPDERLAALPLISAHRDPQVSPQEYACGCVTVTRITDRDIRLGEYPFEMRLAVHCKTEACAIAETLKVSQRDPSDEEFGLWCAALKACRYCSENFYGPVCGCERRYP